MLICLYRINFRNGLSSILVDDLSTLFFFDLAVSCTVISGYWKADLRKLNLILVEQVVADYSWLVLRVGHDSAASCWLPVWSLSQERVILVHLRCYFVTIHCRRVQVDQDHCVLQFAAKLLFVVDEHLDSINLVQSKVRDDAMSLEFLLDRVALFFILINYKYFRSASTDAALRLTAESYVFIS